MTHTELAKSLCSDKRHGIPALEMRRKPWECKQCNKLVEAFQDIEQNAIGEIWQMLLKMRDDCIGDQDDHAQMEIVLQVIRAITMEKPRTTKRKRSNVVR
ncbi:MAG: hypothetical protein E2O29_01585 [Deltaproteobacteria bacterium]|nr:MAG: hypothetical protein E2O29_01585 [Deltaproteobacteria bacterium]